MKVKCPRCQTMIDIDERRYQPDSIAEEKCTLCDTVIQFHVPSEESQLVKQLVVDVETMKAQIEQMREELDTLRSQRQETKQPMSQKPMAEPISYDVTHQSPNYRPTPRPMQRNAQPVPPVRKALVSAEPQSIVTKTLFAGLPQDDLFTDAQPQANNKSFYKLEIHGDNSGEFEFISNATTINYARSSTTDFIECACNIMDNSNDNFSAVVTTKRGKIERQGLAWHIVQNAEVILK